MPEVIVSNQYRHIVSELHKAHLEKRITAQEFSQRMDEASEEEAKKQEHLGPSLVRQALENVEKNISDEQKRAFEAKVQEERLAQKQLRQKEEYEQRVRDKKVWDERKATERKQQEEQRMLELEQENKEKEHLSFRKVTGSTITERDESAKKLQRQYNILQIILLVFSAVTATMAGIDGIARGLVAFTGVIATIAGGMLTTFKIQDRIYANHKAVAELRLECQKYDYHIEEYKNISAEEAFIKFSRAINIIQGEQMLQEVELWNPKRGEGKKNQQDMKADKQEEKASEKLEDVEIPEEKMSGDIFEEQGEKQNEVASSSLEMDPLAKSGNPITFSE